MGACLSLTSKQHQQPYPALFRPVLGCLWPLASGTHISVLHPHSYSGLSDNCFWPTSCSARGEPSYKAPHKHQYVLVNKDRPCRTRASCSFLLFCRIHSPQIIRIPLAGTALPHRPTRILMPWAFQPNCRFAAGMAPPHMTVCLRLRRAFALKLRQCVTRLNTPSTGCRPVVHPTKRKEIVWQKKN